MRVEQTKKKIPSYQSKTLHYTHIFPARRRLKQKSKPQTKPHFASSSGLAVSQAEGRSSRAHTTIPVAHLASYMGTVPAEHVPCSAFTRYSWKTWGSVTKCLSLPTSEMGKCFCNAFWNPCIKGTFKNSCFQQHFGETTGNNLKKITTWASAVTFLVDSSRKPPWCSGSGPTYFPVQRDKTKRSETLPLYLLSGWTL